MPAHPNASSAVHITALLEAYHAGTLPPEQVALIERHLSECRACRERSEDSAVYQVIRSAPAPTVGPELRQRVYAAIAAESAESAEPTATSAIPHARLRERSRERWAPFTEASHAQSHMPHRWLSGAVALIVVALIAGLLISAPRAGRQGQPGQVTHQTSVTTACPASATKVDIPQHAIVGSLVMTSPTDGWATGGIRTENLNIALGLIWKISHCHWTPISIDLNGVALGRISMDSPTDGWDYGMTASGSVILLHYSQGVWNRASAPTELASGLDSPNEIQAFGAGDVWIRAYTHKTNTGQMSPMALLHLHNGAWTSVESPVPMISSLAPVGLDDLWLAGTTNDSSPRFEFAHYHAGGWNTMDAPTAGDDTLHAVSPTDIWASASGGATFAHYDGVAWRDVSQPLPPTTGSLVASYALGNDAQWVVQSSPQQANGPGANTIAVSKIWREVGGQWQDLHWPFHDVYTMLSWTPISDGEFWAIGGYMVEIPDPTQTNPRGTSGMGYTQTVVLHYADGAWTRYG